MGVQRPLRREQNAPFFVRRVGGQNRVQGSARHVKWSGAEWYIVGKV